MEEVLFVSALLSLGAWLGLILARDCFWRAQPRDDGLHPYHGADMPSVVAIVPARNEALTIERALRSLQGQRYGSPFRIVMVDDSSTDETAAIAHDLAAGRGHALEVVAAGPLPRGWMGKMWTLSSGVRHVEALQPEWLLFTDADIQHDPDTLARLVGKARSENLDLVSLMVRLRSESVFERLLIPAFVFFFQMLYPFPAVNRADCKVAAAAGGCVLIRFETLQSAGGIEAIRNELIDDVALARRIKSRGGRLWLGLATATRSLRAYDTLGSIWGMVARSADTQIGHSLPALAGTVAGMALVFLMPPVLLVVGCTTGQAALILPAAVTMVLMVMAYLPMVRFYALAPHWALTLPAAALLYVLMTIDSAVQYRSGRGGVWKGRVAAVQHDDMPD